MIVNLKKITLTSIFPMSYLLSFYWSMSKNKPFTGEDPYEMFSKNKLPIFDMSKEYLTPPSPHLVLTPKLQKCPDLHLPRVKF